MSMSPDARKRLPVKPSEEHLRKQAKRRAKTDEIPLATAQQRLATEYGCHHWAELMHVVETMNRGADQLVAVKREVEPLPKAVRARDVALVRQLLAAGGFTQHDLDAGLAHAAWYGGAAPTVLAERKELFDLLLDHGADPDGQYGSAYGPIVFGCGECLDPNGLQWLLDAGCDVTFPPVATKYGSMCPLATWLGSYARGSNEQKHRGIAMMLQHGAVVPPGVTPALLAIHQGDAAGLATLLEQDPTLVRQTFADMPYGNIELRGATLLHAAVEFDELACIGVLLQHGADVNARADALAGVGGQTPLFHLLNTGWGGHFATLEYLLQHARTPLDLSVRATWRTWEGPRTTAVTALEYALEPGDAKWRKHRDDEVALLRALASDQPLHRACAMGDVAAAAQALAAGANPRRVIDEEHTTPLLVAARRGPLAMVELLIRHGAKEWQANRQGRKPVDAARAGRGPDRDAIVTLLDRPVIRDPHFRQAVTALHAGDLAGLQRLLAAHPELAQARAVEPDCYPQDYFRDPRLLWFVADNPNLVAAMPANSVALAEAIIEAGATREDLTYTLGLVMTSQPAREQGLQRPLMKLLLARGAEVHSSDIYATLGHWERDAATALLESGVPLTAALAAGLGRVAELPSLLATANETERHAAFCLAVINREVAAARLCLEAGADVNRFLIVHVHSTALHQAAVNDDVPMLALLVAHGARRDVRDTLWGGTPLGWAIHTGKAAARAYLEPLGDK